MNTTEPSQILNHRWATPHFTHIALIKTSDLQVNHWNESHKNFSTMRKRISKNSKDVWYLQKSDSAGGRQNRAEGIPWGRVEVSLTNSSNVFYLLPSISWPLSQTSLSCFCQLGEAQIRAAQHRGANSNRKFCHIFVGDPRTTCSVVIKSFKNCNVLYYRLVHKFSILVILYLIYVLMNKVQRDNLLY